MTKEFTEANFDSEVKNIEGVVVVDFWAAWCGPCRTLGPIIEELAGEMSGKASIGKLNVDDNPNLATSYEVRSIPTVIIFKNGEAVDRITGVLPKEQLAEKINAVL